MSSFATIRRYYLIYEKVSAGHYPTFSEIMDCLHAHGFEISPRTLQRDIERLRCDYGIELVWDKNTNGYYIDAEQSIKPDVFLRFLDIVGTAEMLTENLKNSKDTLRFLHFEAKGYFKGVNLIPTIRKAIQQSKCISFSHQGFQSDTPKAWTLAPYLLKEYQNRWYVIGQPEGEDCFLNFGLDRVSKLKMLGKRFARKPQGPEEMLENTIGLTWNTSDVKEVVFSVIKPYDNYVKNLPLHHSQEVIEETDTYTVFRIYVRLNYELIQKLMTHSYKLTVLKPESLADEICTHFEEALRNYNTGKNRASKKNKKI